MKKNLIIFYSICTLYFAFCNLQSFGQQPPQYTQYLFNNYLINPAIGGSKEYTDIKLGYRTQWIGFGAAPKTYFISAHTSLRNKKCEPKKFGTRNHHGIGGYIIRDETGPISRMGIYLSYAHHIRVSYKTRVALGIFGGAMQYLLNSGGMRTAEPDPDIVSISTIAPDASAGIWAYSDKYFGGISAQQLLPLKLGGTGNKLKNHFFITAGYIKQIKGYGTLIPSAHVKLGLLTPVSFDINVRYDWLNKFWIGISYRKVEGILGLVGFNIGMFEVGYAYDFTLSRLRKYSGSTHEIIIGFRVPKKEQDYRCPIW
ncbi:MAG: type IX secretion system membrane protein PorP/SprF [Bacteroidota bacterium]